MTALDSHRTMDPTVNWACKGSRCALLKRIIPKPCPLPTRPVEKLSSMKPIPGAKKGGDCWFNLKGIRLEVKHKLWWFHISTLLLILPPSIGSWVVTSKLEVLGLCSESNQVSMYQIIDPVKTRQLPTFKYTWLVPGEFCKAFKIHCALVSPNLNVEK